MRKYYINEGDKKIKKKERTSFENSQYLHAIHGRLAKNVMD
jgi:hypothetical protein